MMKLIERLLSLSILLFFVSSCFYKSSKINSVDESSNCDKYETTMDYEDIEVLNRSLILGRENCTSNDISFCSDGYGQPYRVFSNFVKYNGESSLIKLYKGNNLFTIDHLLLFNILENRTPDFEIQESNAMDSLFVNFNKTETRCIEFDSPKLKKAYAKQDIKLKIDRKFNGVYLLDLFKVDFKCIYLGKRCMIIPRMSKKIGEKMNQKIESVLVDYYDIIEIESISTISSSNAGL